MTKSQKNGMHGVYATAAEFAYSGFIVSPTSRSAFGADLLVTDNQCQRSWSVQVKTNQSAAANFWLLSAQCEKLKSESHVYVFVAQRAMDGPSFLSFQAVSLRRMYGRTKNPAGSFILLPATQNGNTGTPKVGRTFLAIPLPQ